MDGFKKKVHAMEQSSKDEALHYLWLLSPFVFIIFREPWLAQKAPEIKFEKYRLANGLQVILHQDRKLPVAHVNLWYHVGSKNEKERRTGFAHLFEHMMFQGSRNANGEYITFIEKAGANLREGGGERHDEF